MAEENKKPRAKIDWEGVEKDYRAGIKTLRQIGDEFGCSHVAIKKKADKEGWSRDLTAKIRAEAEERVTKRLVTNLVTEEQLVTERQIVDVNATMLADAVINERSDIKRARSVVQKLWALVDAELDHPVEMEGLGELLQSPDESGRDRLNEMYQAAISLPQQIKNAKALADALKILIELERKVLKLDNDDANDFAKKFGEGVAMGAADAYAKMLNG